MPARIGRTKRSEKGLLTPDNCVVALIDHQPQMMFGVANFDRQSIINNTVALAKATRVFEVPVVLTSVETNSHQTAPSGGPLEARRRLTARTHESGRPGSNRRRPAWETVPGVAKGARSTYVTFDSTPA